MKGYLGFRKIDPSTTVNLLPIVLDKASYEAMIAETTTDQYTYTSGLGNGTVTDGADGVHESKMYPLASGDPGNWGTVKIGVNNNSTSTLSPRFATGSPPPSSQRSPTVRSSSTNRLARRRSRLAATPASARGSRTI